MAVPVLLAALLVASGRFPRPPVGELIAARRAHALGPGCPLEAPIHRPADHTTRPRHVCGWAGPHEAVLVSVLLGIDSTLAVERVRHVVLPLQPALPKRVVPPCIQAPADGEGTKHPRVARALRMRLRVLNAGIAALLRRGLAVVDAEDDRHSASVGMGLFHALRRGRHARAVGEAAGDRLWPVAQAVAAAVPGTVFVARDDSGVSQRTTVDNFTLLCRAPQRRGRSDPVRLLSD
mmetsp:Transcript_20650/g.66868  ORF Transcript_20650/g.66868 Transcript_20650/m.66868 type:complete len:235 (+) Transcript_20650:445-1149(+)